MRLAFSIVASVLIAAATARPRPLSDGDPLTQKSRITAFVISADGNPSVECWEISNMVDSMRTQRRSRGSETTAHSMALASSHELEGLDILTWPTYSPIWPPSADSLHSEWFDMSQTFNLFTVQGGLINFNVNFRLGSTGNDHDDDEASTHIFSLENGDDWFYFEDSSSDSDLSRSADAKPYPFSISTISATETELLRLRYNAQPTHKVLHKGSCSFTGISTPAGDSSYTGGASRKHSPLTVQVSVEEL